MSKAPTQYLPHPSDTERTKWVRRLQEAETHLRELLGDEVDAVLGSGGQSYLLQQAQKKLMESEADARRNMATQNAVLDTIDSHIALLDNNGVILFVNEAWRRFSERNTWKAPQHGVGQNYIEICGKVSGLTAEETRQVAEGIRSVLQKEAPRFVMQYEFHSPGEERNFRLTVVPLRDSATGGAVVKHYDMTDILKAERVAREGEVRFNQATEMFATSLRRNEAMLRDAQRIARFGSWELDLANLEQVDANPLRWSDEVFRIFGYEAGAIEVSSENFFRFVHPEDREGIKTAVDEAIRENKNYEIDHRIILPDGTVRFVHEEAQVFRDPATGRPIKMTGIVQDITERRKKEEALRISEERFVSAFEHAPIGMALVSPEGRWLRVNRALCTLVGYTTEELLASTFQDITHPDDLNTDMDYLRKMLAEEIYHYEMEKRYFHKKGHIVRVLLSVSLVRDSEGTPLYFVSQVQDITGRKESELHLQRLNRIYSVLSKVNEAIVRATDEKELCQKACQIIVEEGAMKLAWVGELDPATKNIVPFASAGMDDGYMKTLKISAVAEPEGNGPSGLAIREGKVSVCQDIATDPRMALWREAALKRGYRSSAAFPLKLGHDRQGLLSFYAGEANFFNREELDLLVSISENMAFALDSIRKERQRLEAEEALRGSEEHYRLLFFGNPHPIWVYDLETLKFLAVNSSALLQYGYSEAEFLAMTVRDVRPPSERSVFDEILRSLPSGGKNRVLTRHLKKNGEVIDVEIFSDAIMFNDRSARLVAATNITERKVFEQKLAEQAALIDEARDAIILRDVEHKILFWNKGAERLHGWTSSEVLGKNSMELLYAHRERVNLAMESLLEKGAWTGELEHFTQAGTPVIVESRWNLIRENDGKPKAILSINTDITERKRMESHLLRAQRMESIGTLAGGIAHDLNNLLAPIIMGVDLLKHFGLEGPARKVVDDIERSAKRGSSLVKQVLSFARGVEGARVALQVRDIIGELESIVHNTFPKNITLETKIADENLLIKGDPTQLNQVLLNLCVNARDAMPNGGRITLAAEATIIDAQYEAQQQGIASGTYVCLDVIDTGCGIPPENIDKIFDPFFTTKELAKGTGLGLATTLSIVRSHGGFLNVSSEPGKGTTFKIYLPVQAEGTKVELEPEGGDCPRGNGEWILLVDDEIPILTITQQTLEAFGYRVLTAEHGAHAIGLFAANREKISIVITDMMMPVMDGAATILALREIDPNIRIIAASGLNANSNVALAANAGVKHFLAKPYTTGTMLTTIKAALTEEA